MFWRDPEGVYTWARVLAGDLISVAPVEKIEVFGSISRGMALGCSDIDMIVVVDTALAKEWLERCQFGFAEDELYTNRRRDRLVHAASVLETPWLGEGWDAALDIFLFPPDWRSRLVELQTAGNHSDPDFMLNIAHDATAFDPVLQTFPMVEQYRAQRIDA